MNQCDICHKHLKREGDWFCKDCDDKYFLCSGCGKSELLRKGYGGPDTGWLCKKCHKQSVKEDKHE